MIVYVGCGLVLTTVLSCTCSPSLLVTS